ncbi:probable leucine-rich repeat receptor-like protein kinase At1g35710 [Mangifera indica]|uniref:probable leucine-rich repeat receptor-like protein kinase At1g35710 n=1 Tax=Mangifera indica TaxID=29780 RepID=UPI001CFAE0F5|nr:probable leucine-rich repeat receptor-like protein kinase At1g35710 [Mangifera indica]
MSTVSVGSLVNLSSSLISLNLWDTQMQGRFPNEIFLFPFLQRLRISSNRDMTSIMPEFNKSSPLRVLDLSLQSLSGKLPNIFDNLVHLNYLSVGDCNFNGSLPPSLENLTEFTYIDLSGNGFTGQGQFPSQISDLSYLRVIYLNNNLMRGRVPAWLFTLPSLESLDLSHNKLTGSIKQFQQPGPIRQVDLSDNKIHGPIPYSIFQLLDLTNLALAKNNFSGNVQLEMLSKLEGPLPSSLVNCQDLNILDVGNNRINDSFPNWLVNFQSLKYMIVILCVTRYFTLVEYLFLGPTNASTARGLLQCNPQAHSSVNASSGEVQGMQQQYIGVFNPSSCSVEREFGPRDAAAKVLVRFYNILASGAKGVQGL